MIQKPIQYLCRITPSYIFRIYFFTDRGDRGDREDNDYNSKPSQGVSLFDFLEEKIPGGAPGAAKNDQKRPEVDQNKRNNERDFDQNDLNQAIQASLRTANNHTGSGRENGGAGNGNNPRNNNNSANGEQRRGDRGDRGSRDKRENNDTRGGMYNTVQCVQKYSRLRCLLCVKGLGIGFYLGQSGHTLLI